jgi:hypothetical protein
VEKACGSAPTPVTVTDDEGAQTTSVGWVHSQSVTPDPRTAWRLRRSVETTCRGLLRRVGGNPKVSGRGGKPQGGWVDFSELSPGSIWLRP